MAWLPNDFSAEDYEEGLRENPDRLCKRSNGEDIYLEAVAANILAAGRRGKTKHSDLRDYLTESQLAMRRGRELQTNQGYPDSHLYSGLYKRAYNPKSRGIHSSNSTRGFGEEDSY